MSADGGLRGAEVLAFVAEIALFVALGAAGYAAGGGGMAGAIGAAAAVAVAAVAWGLLMAPRSARRLSRGARAAVVSVAGALLVAGLVMLDRTGFVAVAALATVGFVASVVLAGPDPPHPNGAP